jgi:hypothetical protein
MSLIKFKKIESKEEKQGNSEEPIERVA